LIKNLKFKIKNYGLGVAVALGVTVGDAFGVTEGVASAFVGVGALVAVGFTLGVADGVAEGVTGPGVGV